MSQQNLGVLLAVIGGIGVAVAGVKLCIIGYYPHELPTFLIIGAVGAALCTAGSKIYQADRQKG